MKWVFINPIKGADWGGMENWMVKLCVGLRGLGDEVAVIGRATSRWPSACREIGVPFRPFIFGGDFSPLAFLQLRPLLRKLAPDAVCAKGFRQARFTRAVFPRAAVVVKLPGPGELGDSRSDRWTFQHAVDRVIMDSAAARRIALRYDWVPPEKVVVVHNGIEPSQEPADHGKVRRELGLGPDERILVALGRLAPGKRYADGLAAFAKSGCAASVRLVIIGDGPERGALERTVRALGLGARVVFAGWRDDAPALVRGCDMFLHPSESEGFPNAVLEAMSAGLAVLATRAGGTPEMIENEKEGLLVDVGDVKGLTDGMKRLAEDDALRGRLGEAAAARARREFTSAVMTAGVRRVFLDAVESRRAARGGA